MAAAAFNSLCAFLMLLLAAVFLLLLPFEATESTASTAGGGRRLINKYNNNWEPLIRSPVDDDDDAAELDFEDDNQGTTWALLIAGSKGFDNYRHQADVCHAYQILKRGGLKDDNIIVFMYDDIANNPLNPRPGVIINRPDGDDVYAGVPKDYTGEQVTAENLFAVLLGDKSSVKGGSGKVVNSTSNDRIFVYYTDHGGPGVLGMPSGPFLYGKDLVEVLKKKHAAKSYNEMVIYIEACESASAVEGLMPEDLNIYVTTASKADESSFAAYCPGMDPSPPPNFPCLGDLYSVAWMEDSESHNLRKETIQMQFNKVKDRTSNHGTYAAGSHVMQYGNKSINTEKLYLYHGYNPATENLPANNVDNASRRMGVVNQRSADLLFLWKRFEQMEEGSAEKGQLLKKIRDIMFHRKHLDSSIEILGAILFGPVNSPSVLNHVRDQGQPIVNDWDCLKSMVHIFENHCGPLTQYGMKHMRAFANICNNGISESAMDRACHFACAGYGLLEGTGVLHSVVSSA